MAPGHCPGLGPSDGARTAVAPSGWHAQARHAQARHAQVRHAQVRHVETLDMHRSRYVSRVSTFEKGVSQSAGLRNVPRGGAVRGPVSR